MGPANYFHWADQGNFVIACFFFFIFHRIILSENWLAFDYSIVCRTRGIISGTDPSSDVHLRLKNFLNRFQDHAEARNQSMRVLFRVGFLTVHTEYLVLGLWVRLGTNVHSSLFNALPIICCRYFYMYSLFLVVHIWFLHIYCDNESIVVSYGIWITNNCPLILPSHPCFAIENT